jgi:hypothetical protein
MPILRLVVIYLLLILAVVAVFNRDKLGRLVFGDPPAEAATVQTPPGQPAAPAQPTAPTAANPAPAPSAAPAAPSPVPAAPMAPAQSAPGILQTPQATPAPAPAQPAPAFPTPSPEPGGALAPDLAEALDAARRAYWAGDIAEAGDQLAALAAAHPANPDLHGELGNFRFANRDYAGAAEAFLRAGELLIAEGRYAQASGLVPVLRQIAPDKAQALATRLQNR